MSTKAIRSLLRKAGSRAGVEEAEREVLEVDRVRKTLREMFGDGRLDPHPTSDASDEIVLRKWCGWRTPKEKP